MKQSSYIALIRSNRSFRYLWSGQIISLCGDWFNLIASAALIATLTQSGTAVGGLFVVRMLAPFLVSPIAGVVADRYSRKRIVISTDLLRAVVVLGFVLVREPEQGLAGLCADRHPERLAGFLFSRLERHPARYHLAVAVERSECAFGSDLVGDAGIWRGAGRAGFGRGRRLSSLRH